jgi:hypothetical protein
VQRRVDQPDDHGQPVHGAEETVEVGTLVRQQGLEALGDDLRVLLVEDHALHVRQAVGLEEHVLGAAQADALGAVLPRAAGVRRIVRVGPHLQAPRCVGPAQQLHQVGVADVGDDGLEPGRVDLARGAVDRHPRALLEHAGADPDPARLEIDLERGDADHGRLAELARHQRGVAGASATAGEDSPGRQHAVDVVRLGLGPDHDHLLAVLLGPAFGGVGVERDLPHGRTR